MTSATFVLLSGTLTFGVPLAVAICELIFLRPSRPGGDEPPPESRLPRAPKPLPDCLLPDHLLPKPLVVRHRPAVRMLEDA